MTTASSFAEHEVVPDVVDKAPENFLEIHYANDMDVQLGNELTPTQVQNVPISFSWPTEANALYTLCFVDPDAPSRANPSSRESLHYLVVNIAGSNVASGETLVEYIGSGPSPGTGLHRYVWLVYKQKDGQKIEDTSIGHISTTTMAGRSHFHISEFAKKHNFETLVAGNFYQARFDRYVLRLMFQMIFGY